MAFLITYLDALGVKDGPLAAQEGLVHVEDGLNGHDVPVLAEDSLEGVESYVAYRAQHKLQVPPECTVNRLILLE